MTRGARAGAAMLLLGALAACVPASNEEQEPRGAAGADIVADDAAKGVPFVTADGWTVTVDELLLVARISSQGMGGGDVTNVVWRGKDHVSTYVPGLDVGAAVIVIELDGIYVDARSGARRGLPSGVDVLSDLPAEDVARIVSPADNAESSAVVSSFSGELVPGPAVYFSAHATKDGRTVKLALSLASPLLDRTTEVTTTQQLTVVRDEVRYVPYTVEAERLFAALDGSLRFGPLAAADAAGNGDGVVSADELHAVSLLDPDASASSCEDDEGYILVSCQSLLDLITDDAQHLVVAKESVVRR